MSKSLSKASQSTRKLHKTSYTQPSLLTLKRAREILGSKAKKMSDKEIENLLRTLRIVCNKTIDSVVEEN